MALFIKGLPYLYMQQLLACLHPRPNLAALIQANSSISQLASGQKMVAGLCTLAEPAPDMQSNSSQESASFHQATETKTAQVKESGQADGVGDGSRKSGRKRVKLKPTLSAAKPQPAFLASTSTTKPPPDQVAAARTSEHTSVPGSGKAGTHRQQSHQQQHRLAADLSNPLPAHRLADVLQSIKGCHTMRELNVVLKDVEGMAMPSAAVAAAMGRLQHLASSIRGRPAEESLLQDMLTQLKPFFYAQADKAKLREAVICMRSLIDLEQRPQRQEIRRVFEAMCRDPGKLRQARPMDVTAFAEIVSSYGVHDIHIWKAISRALEHRSATMAPEECVDALLACATMPQLQSGRHGASLFNALCQRTQAIVPLFNSNSLARAVWAAAKVAKDTKTRQPRLPQPDAKQLPVTESGVVVLGSQGHGASMSSGGSAAQHSSALQHIPNHHSPHLAATALQSTSHEPPAPQDLHKSGQADADPGQHSLQLTDMVHGPTLQVQTPQHTSAHQLLCKAEPLLISQGLKDLHPQSLPQLCWAASYLGLKDGALYEQIAQALPKVSGTLGADSLCTLAQALYDAGHHELSSFEPIYSQGISRLDRMGTRHWAQLVTLAAAMNHHETELGKTFLNRVCKLIMRTGSHRYEGREIAMLVSGLTKAGVKDEEVLRELATMATLRAKLTPLHHLRMILDSFVEAGHFHGDLLKAATLKALAAAQQLQAASLASLPQDPEDAFDDPVEPNDDTPSKKHVPPPISWFSPEAASSHARQQSKQLARKKQKPEDNPANMPSADSLARILFDVAYFGFKPLTLLDACAPVLLSRLSQLKPPQLVRLAWAYATAAYPDQRLYRSIFEQLELQDRSALSEQDLLLLYQAAVLADAAETYRPPEKRSLRRRKQKKDRQHQASAQGQGAHAAANDQADSTWGTQKQHRPGTADAGESTENQGTQSRSHREPAGGMQNADPYGQTASSAEGQAGGAPGGKHTSTPQGQADFYADAEAHVSAGRQRAGRADHFDDHLHGDGPSSNADRLREQDDDHDDEQEGVSSSSSSESDSQSDTDVDEDSSDSSSSDEEETKQKTNATTDRAFKQQHKLYVSLLDALRAAEANSRGVIQDVKKGSGMSVIVHARAKKHVVKKHFIAPRLQPSFLDVDGSVPEYQDLSILVEFVPSDQTFYSHPQGINGLESEPGRPDLRHESLGSLQPSGGAAGAQIFTPPHIPAARLGVGLGQRLLWQLKGYHVLTVHEKEWVGLNDMPCRIKFLKKKLAVFGVALPT